MEETFLSHLFHEEADHYRIISTGDILKENNFFLVDLLCIINPLFSKIALTSADQVLLSIRGTVRLWKKQKRWLGIFRWSTHLWGHVVLWQCASLSLTKLLTSLEIKVNLKTGLQYISVLTTVVQKLLRKLEWCKFVYRYSQKACPVMVSECRSPPWKKTVLAHL